MISSLLPRQLPQPIHQPVHITLPNKRGQRNPHARPPQCRTLEHLPAIAQGGEERAAIYTVERDRAINRAVSDTMPSLARQFRQTITCSEAKSAKSVIISIFFFVEWWLEPNFSDHKEELFTALVTVHPFRAHRGAGSPIWEGNRHCANEESVPPQPGGRLGGGQSLNRNPHSI